MARPEKLRLEVKQAVDAGRAENVFRFRDKTIQVHGAFVGTLQLEGSVEVLPAPGAKFVIRFRER
jgi:hypothetical protein